MRIEGDRIANHRPRNPHLRNHAQQTKRFVEARKIAIDERATVAS